MSVVARLAETSEEPVRRHLRVLQVGKFYPPHHGGIESHIRALSTELRRHVDVRVVVASEDRRDSVEILDAVEVKRIGTRFTLAGAPVCPGMAAEIRRSGADIVHLHLPNPAAVLAYLASGHRGTLVVSYHSDIVRQRLLGTFFDPFLQWALRRAAAIVVATPNYLDSSPTLSRHRDRCVVIPYGVLQSDYEVADNEVQALRRRFGDRIVLGVGRLVYYKGFEHIIDAMPSVDGHLLIVGDGPLRADLEARAVARGVADRVTFVGGVERTAPYYHAADVFVLASVARSEAFGIVQLEAMACGTPVVNTGLTSGVPFVSRDGETGITVPPGDPAALAIATNRLLDDARLRTAYGAAARERVLAEFDQGEMGERMLELYEQLISRTVATQRGPVALRPGVDCAL